MISSNLLLSLSSRTEMYTCSPSPSITVMLFRSRFSSPAIQVISLIKILNCKFNDEEISGIFAEIAKLSVSSLGLEGVSFYFQYFSQFCKGSISQCVLFTPKRQYNYFLTSKEVFVAREVLVFKEWFCDCFYFYLNCYIYQYIIRNFYLNFVGIKKL